MRWIDCLLLYTAWVRETGKRGNDLCVSRRGEQLQLFAREYRRDIDDTNDDIVFNEGERPR